jgi:cytoskeletal protein RodZ
MLKDDGTMGETESQLDITIRGPWYTSWWALLIYILLIGLAVWIWQKTKQRKQQLASQQAEEHEEMPEEETTPVEDEDVEEAILMNDDE